MFITQALAQEAAAPANQAAGLEQFIPLLLIFVVFYFLLIRPQQKKMKQHKEMLDTLRRGDEVVLGGGILGKIIKVGDPEVSVEIADGVRVKVLKSSIAEVKAKTEPASAGKTEEEPENDNKTENK